MDAYDVVPYDSLPIRETHPELLAVLGRLYGLETPDPQRARVLELGCASGGNLIPMAFYLPDARFVGIDLSAQQVAQGQRRIASLALGNIDLRQGDLAFLGAEDPGEFDYIIAHGVYSWVPEPVREALLALCRARLSVNGVAYISYNTLPGWRMRGMLCDIALYAARTGDTPSAKARAVRAGLTRLQSAQGDLGALSARYLRAEIPALLDNPDSYLLHEYLAENNTAFLFSDFFAAAERHQLTYLCDAELHTEFPQLLGDAAEAALADIDDAIALGQWLDFVRARNLRRSLLVRDDAQPGEGIDLDAFAQFAFFADLVPPAKLDLRKAKRIPFRRPDGESFDVEHPLTKAALLELCTRYPDAVRMNDLLPAASQRLVAEGGERYVAQSEELFAEWFALFTRGAVRARRAPFHHRRNSTAAPRPNVLAREQIDAGETQVSTLHHEAFTLDASMRDFLRSLDGTPPPASAEKTRWLEQFARYGLLE